MGYDIRPLRLDDIPELSQFLSAGFHAPPHADFVAPEVLRWKYLERLEGRSVAGGANVGDESGGEFDPDHRDDTAAPRSYIARDDTGQIIGHLGLCRTTFEGQAIPSDGGSVTTTHFIDWLGSRGHRSIGVSLLRRAHESVTTQFTVGASELALQVGERVGYELRGLVPVYSRVFRARHWLRAGRSGFVERGLRLVRDVVNLAARRWTVPRRSVTLRRVSAFSDEIAPVVAAAKAHAIFTGREPARLNAFLRFPRQAISGWHLLDETGRLRGFALLNVVPRDQGLTRVGKVIDCMVDEIDIALWHSAMLALTRELQRQGADVAQAYASNEWTAEALRRSGYVTRFAVKFLLRDPLALVPHGATFHHTFIEADYAYT
jgi:hypothetical protein